MITASHNPPEYNGMKIRGKEGFPVAGGSGMEEIRDIVGSEKYMRGESDGTVEILDDLRGKYAAFLTKKNKMNQVRAVVDACGGATTFILPHVLEKLSSLIYKPLFFEPDGEFRHHSPNPLDANSQKYIAKELRSGTYRFGAIFDGDGDRVLFFDEKGSPISSEYIGALFMDEFLKKEKNAVVVMPPNTSRGVREYITNQGGNVKLSRVGYAFIQPMMKKNGAVLGVELSGHFHFKDFFFKDSGIFALVKFAEILSRTSRPLSQLISPMRRYISSGEINFTIKNKNELLQKIGAHYFQLKNAKISNIDGVSIDFPDWWFNVRASNTEPLMRLVLEAKTEKLFQEKFAEIKKFLK